MRSTARPCSCAPRATGARSASRRCSRSFGRAAHDRRARTPSATWADAAFSTGARRSGDAGGAGAARLRAGPRRRRRVVGLAERRRARSPARSRRTRALIASPNGPPRHRARGGCCWTCCAIYATVATTIVFVALPRRCWSTSDAAPCFATASRAVGARVERADRELVVARDARPRPGPAYPSGRRRPPAAPVFAARGLTRRARPRRQLRASRRARSSGSRGWPAAAAPRSRARSSAPTAPTPASCGSTAAWPGRARQAIAAGVTSAGGPARGAC